MSKTLKIGGVCLKILQQTGCLNSNKQQQTPKQLFVF